MSISSLLTFKRGRSLFLPSHGRGTALPKELKRLLKNRAGIWDLPELPGLGGPLERHGEVAISQQRAALRFGAKRGWYGVNGATGLLQAALFSIARPGQAVLMPRNVHRSLIHACALSDCRPVLFDIPFLSDRGHAAPPDEMWMQAVLDDLSISGVEIAAAVLVNPTYHGYSADLKTLVKMFHQRGWPVLVDEAHGAHFASGLDNELPASGLSVGADLVVHSLHKSAVGLVQTAVLWLNGDLVDPIALERSIGWVQTSSPSSLLLASCEAALNEWNGSSGQSNLMARITEARQIVFQLRELGIPMLHTQDPLKLILHSAIVGISGFEADDFLIHRGVVAELPEPGCLTFCLGFAAQRGLIGLLKRAWDSLIASHPEREPLKPFAAPPASKLMTSSMSCASAWRSSSKLINLNEAVGNISAELICPYPPGIPMLIPGESLDQTRVEWLLEQKRLWPNQISSQLRVVNQ